MKIEKIRIQNLNSLKGCWELDLTVPDIVNKHSFLLWGDMGAGKSTVLDAITLALYGKTPRQERINKSAGNEVMTRGTRECTAEVTFSVSGTRYRAYWHQEKARTGTLKDYRRELCVLNGTDDVGELICDSNNSINDCVAKIVHLTYEQFTKVVLLEQGGFAAFLNSDEAARADILEKLTDTNIYTEISKKAFERRKQEEEKLEVLKARLDGIQLMSDEEYKDCEDAIREGTEKAANLGQEVKQYRDQVTWLGRIEENEKKSASIAVENESHQQNVEAFEKERPVLERGERAEKICSLHALYRTRVNEWAECQNALKLLENQIPSIENQAVGLRNVEITALEKLNAVKANLEERKPIWEKARDVESQGKLASQSSQKALQDYKNGENTRAMRVQALATMKQDLVAAENAMKLEDEWCQAHQEDDGLSCDLGRIKEMCKQLETLSSELRDADNKSQEAQAALDKSRHNLVNEQKVQQKLEETCESADLEFQNLKAAFNKMLDGHSIIDLRESVNDLEDSRRRAEVDEAREKTMLEHRHELKTGEPCPLCGALEHPWAETGNPGIKSASDIAKKIDEKKKLITSLEMLQDEANRAEHILADHKRELDKTLVKIDGLNQLVKSDSERYEDCLRLSEEKKIAVEQSIASIHEVASVYHEAVTNLLDAKRVLGSLELRFKNWSEHSEHLKALENQRTEKLHRIETANAEFETIVANVEKLKADWDALNQIVNQLRQEYVDIMGPNNSANAEEKRLLNELACAENTFNQAHLECTNAEKELQQIRTRRDEMQKRLGDCEDKKEKAKVVFDDALVENSFKDENDYLASVLDSGRLETLKKRAENLKIVGVELESRKKDVEETLSTLRAQHLTDRTVDEVNALLSSSEKILDELKANLAANKQKLKANEEQGEKCREQQMLINVQRAEFDRWNKLSGLIGASDGKKYKMFAQGLTFDILVRKANHYLQNKKLLERYELVENEGSESSLNFKVRDYDMGTVSSASNLSGGEKFCVSLALALALADMASENVKIETLLLDEGLGTLDENTLNTALTMLSNLSSNSDGKLVGLITHVEQAKTKIGTILSVIKQGGGHSRLDGPGCRKCAEILSLSKVETDAKPTAKRGRSRKTQA